MTQASSQVGVAEAEGDENLLVLADVPGLIAGARLGLGVVNG